MAYHWKQGIYIYRPTGVEAGQVGYFSTATVIRDRSRNNNMEGNNIVPFVLILPLNMTVVHVERFFYEGLGRIGSYISSVLNIFGVYGPVVWVGT